jgi:hypothetical protein
MRGWANVVTQRKQSPRPSPQPSPRLRGEGDSRALPYAAFSNSSVPAAVLEIGMW